MHTDGTDLPFLGHYVNYKKTGLAAEHFQTIAPGETVNSSVNVANTYSLAGLETVDVTAIQGFRYVTGSTAPGSLNGLETCDDATSNTVTITPDQSQITE